MFALQFLAIVGSVFALMVFLTKPMHYAMMAARAIGIGYLVWHRDSNKYFYALTYKDALEWMASTYDCATMFSNFTQEALQIKFTKLSPKV